MIQRVCGWLAGCTAGDGRILAVTHAAIIRAAVVAALGAPPVAFWRIDVAPLTFKRLNGQTGRWTLAASNLSSIS
jgi:broad specificity phosphatase PhoE